MDGPWAFPYTLLKWCLLAKWVGTKVAFLCCGAGPLDSRLGKLFIRWSMSLADCRSFRDQVSRSLIEGIGVSGDHPVCTDLAYGLRPPRRTQPESPRSRLIVGVNPVPFFDARYWAEHNSELYQQYVRKIAAFAQWLNERGHSVLFFPTQLHADPLVIQDIRDVLKSRGIPDFAHTLGDQPMSSVSDLLSRISVMDIVVATRYHGILLSALVQTPILAIAYHEKSSDLMAQIGQSEYVVDIDSFDVGPLAERFVAIESRTEAIRRQLEHRTLLLRHALDREYDRVFTLLGDSSSADTADGRMVAPARLNASKRTV